MAARPRKRCRLDEPAGDSGLGLADVLDFPSRFLKHLDSNAERQKHAHQLIANMLRNEIIVTSCYSGIGGAETASSMLASCVASTCAQAPRMQHYSVCENKAAAVAALKNHPSLAEASHIFGNILDRLPTQVRHMCEELQTQASAEWLDIKKSGRRSREHRELLEHKLFNKLCGILDAVEFDQEAFCEKHGTTCPLNVRATRGNDGYIHVEMAGTTCLAWSSIGARDGWLHHSTLPCLVWIYSTRFFEPDIIIHENGPPAR